MSQTAAPAPANLSAKLADVPVTVSVLIGEKAVSLDELSRWAPDTLVPLKESAQAPLRLLVGGIEIATAELCEGEEGPGSLAIRILDVTGG
ncbi:FliM/FliN family flagellar motor switch protein [Parvularcula dongshanensis]|uniref:Flagellar motor switch/type III secretory pathway protein FliN n=1 Tax=Parvularcula dongshanensis TaxID=1173995 RepID=A0A840I5S1_9PROT|nr:FliM/FliN family flagellar motor C-terminal domain-containing protein [Parvularcula dongshanensis]MBB4659621.1 flagellar motor switch/type III secretory pathway protein FliN [Parvularcula dongshanensis]